jgi:hypothetical protein
MHLRIHNILIATLVIVVTVMATRLESPIRIFLRSLTQVGSEYPDGQRLRGLIAWVLLTILFIVLLRRFTHHRNR